MALIRDFGDLQAEIVRLRNAGQLSEALDLIRREGHRFPDQAAYTYLASMRLNCELGLIDEGVRVLAEALAAGCRYPLPVLQNEQFKPLRDVAEFQRLAHHAAMRYDSELGATTPKLVVRRPASTPVGTLLVLHGNNSSTDQTAPHWEHARELRWVLAFAQSAEISWSPGLFVWNDPARARSQVLQHLAELSESVEPPHLPIVLAGFSMGALRALELAASVADRMSGVIAVGAYLPHDAAEHLAASLSIPTAIVIGERDEEGRPGSETIERGLRERGVPVRLEVVPGLGHDYPSDVARRFETALSLFSRSTSGTV
ncbi:MAG: alpha/beta hydrolase [Candidatus Limnocylindria bacterium]